MNRIIRRTYIRVALAFAGTVGMTFLAGCGVKNSVAPPDSQKNAQVQGVVYAGRNYMPNAKVKLYSTTSSGVATNGVYVGSAKLLGTATANGVGGWTMNGISCSSPDMLYATAEGGNPFISGTNVDTGMPNNPNSLMMVAIGDCSALSSSQTIVIDEASTVAAVYTLNPFISLSGTTVNVTSSATNYAGSNGIGTATSAAGLKHAFQNALNLSPYSVGNFMQYTNNFADAVSGAVIPVQELNSLAYIQYLCTIGSDNKQGDYSYCNQLFTLATPPGGTAPTNTLQAMLNIARNPANNATALYSFSRYPVPFTSHRCLVKSYFITNGTIIFNCGSGTPPSTTATYYSVTTYGFATSTFLNNQQFVVLAPTKQPDGTWLLNGTIPIDPTTQFAATITAVDTPLTTESGIADLAQPNNAGVYIPALTAAPQDWSVALYFAKGFGAATGAQGLTYPLFIAHDADDNAYVSNNNGSPSGQANMLALSHDSKLLWITPTDISVTNLAGVAVDALGHVFATNNATTVGSSLIREYDQATGNKLQDITSTSLNLQGVTVDRANNVWYVANNTTSPNIHQLTYGGGTTYTEKVFPVPPVATQPLYQVVLDSNQNVWAAGQSATSPQAFLFPNSGTQTAPAYALPITATAGITGANGYGIAVDASGKAYMGTNSIVANDNLNQVWKITPNNALGATSITASSVSTNPATAQRNAFMDGNNNFWTVNNSSGTPIYRYPTTGGAVTSYYGCLPAITNSPNNVTNTCGTPLNSKIDISIDATGSVWIPSAGSGYVVEILGAASPVWPLKSLGKPGVMP